MRIAIPLPALGELELPTVSVVGAVCAGYALVEAMSVAENLKRGGVWVPEWLIERFGRFRPGALHEAAAQRPQLPRTGDGQASR